ncbi:HU family DNA-binding protein [Candidatus Magnetominusculus xianensis]|uniref:Transcriptional regulator HU subunit alpha n=1 Tax=Candidatus Magnetominusculus xianensis TaxID=1748249 RepID=A0ABR5SBD1_9BACT|nr:HU family DNA-binding protein [Candidatus Magnetominusculus xianensis]KWT75951.1 transcriptional regulator HU subunit alpha [Candidatus Magnetominusculus xianensis]MBF0405043.1 HU family DNA-binding protein [Nitrospirota bacterium]
MNKAELIELVASAANIKKTEATKAVDAVLNSITQSVAKGEKVALAGFGTFLVSDRKARIGHNPKTGAELKIAVCRTPKFTAGKGFKELVNGDKGK